MWGKVYFPKLDNYSQQRLYIVWRVHCCSSAESHDSRRDKWDGEDCAADDWGQLSGIRQGDTARAGQGDPGTACRVWRDVPWPRASVEYRRAGGDVDWWPDWTVGCPVLCGVLWWNVSGVGESEEGEGGGSGKIGRGKNTSIGSLAQSRSQPLPPFFPGISIVQATSCRLHWWRRKPLRRGSAESLPSLDRRPSRSVNVMWDRWCCVGTTERGGIFGERERAHNLHEPSYNLNLRTTKIGRRYRQPRSGETEGE